MPWRQQPVPEAVSPLTITPSAPRSPQQAHLLLPRRQHQGQRGPAARCTPGQHSGHRLLAPVTGVAEPLSVAARAPGAASPLCGYWLRSTIRRKIELKCFECKRENRRKQHVCSFEGCRRKQQQPNVVSASAPRTAVRRPQGLRAAPCFAPQAGTAARSGLCGRTVGSTRGKPTKRKQYAK